MSTHRAIQLGVTALSAFALVASGASPVHAVLGSDLTGLSDPFGIAFTAAGDPMVANHAGGTGNSVAVFPSTATSPDTARVLKGVANATGVAVSPVNGDVVVTDFWAGMVYRYHAGMSTPDDTLTRDIPGAFDVAIDRDGEIYVSSPVLNKVMVLDRTSVGITREFAHNRKPRGLAVHPRTGEIYIGSEQDARIHIYPHGSGIFDPARDLVGPDGNALAPFGIDIHPANGRVYAVDWNDDLVMVFEPGAVTPTASLSMSTGSDTMGIGIHPLTGAIYRSSWGQDKVLVSDGPSMSLTGVGPNFGPMTGGTPVTISGANLGAVTGVSFGGVAATNVVAVSPTSVTAVAPAHAVGKVEVAVSWGPQTAGLSQAFEYTAVAPGKATALTGVPGNGQVAVSWTPPADTGGVPVASYTVTPSPAGPACATTATSCTIAGLTNGTQYKFVVRTTNTANLSTDSEASAEVKPYIPIRQKVKAKKASSKLPRKGFTTVVNWVKRPAYSARDMTANCTDGTARTTNQLCRVYSYKTGKVKVRTKGHRNVQVTITLKAIPKAGAPAQYGPSTTWTRTWRVR